MKDQYIDRKEIAAAAGVCEKTVRNKEADWGLYPLRAKHKTHPILYDRAKARPQLATVGIQVP